MVTICSARERVDAIDHRRQRRGLTGTGDAGDQHQPARHVANLLHHFGQEQFVERANLGGNDAKHQSDVAALLEDVHTEAAQPGDAVGHIDFRGLFEFLFLPRRHHAEGHVQHVFRGDARLVGQRQQFAVDAQVRIVAHLQMQVAKPCVPSRYEADHQYSCGLFPRKPEGASSSSSMMLRIVTLPKMT